jgi:hypothetical protein
MRQGRKIRLNGKIRTGLINGILKGHDFSRAEKAAKNRGALAPEGYCLRAEQYLCNQF